MIRDELMINKTHRKMIDNHSHHFSSTGTTSNTVDEGHCKGDSEDTMELKELGEEEGKRMMKQCQSWKRKLIINDKMGATKKVKQEGRTSSASDD